MNDFHFSFNLENFGLGVLAGWGTAYALYRARHLIQRTRRSMSSAQAYASRSADKRYSGDLIRYSQRAHLAGRRVELTQVVVEPRFIAAPELAGPADDEVTHSVFHVVPRVPDHPYLHAPYNIETLGIEDLDGGVRALALLGVPGSGRTTALHTIALWSQRQVSFDAPPDKVQQQLEADEAAIADREDRLEARRNRQATEKMALESLERRRGNLLDENTAMRKADNHHAPIRHLTPIYAHLGNVVLRSGEYGRDIDPAEPLIRAVQQYTGRITAKTLPRNLYRCLNQGAGLLLLDGYDDVPATERPALCAWLRALLEIYADNFFIVAGPATGYGGLTQVGLTPVFLRPWNDMMTDGLTDRWGQAWPEIAGRRRGADLDPRTVERAKQRNRARTPFELTIKLWTQFETQDVSSLDDWMHNLIGQYVPGQKLDEALPQLVTAAALQTEAGYITLRELDQRLFGGASDAPDEQPAPPEAEAVADAETDALLDEFERELDAVEGESDDGLTHDDDIFEDVEPESAPAGPLRQDGEKSRTVRQTARLLRRLVNSGLLERFRGGRYQLRHPLITAYLGSLYLKELAEDELLEKSYQPEWEPALIYLAGHSPVDALVEAHTSSPADILHNHLLEASRWLAYAGGSVAWRSPLLKELGNLFVAPNQYPQLRERVAAALVGTRDRNALVVFRKALRHPNADVRRLACLGLGALRADDALDDIAGRLQDGSTDVMLAAGLALGAINTEDSLHLMADALMQGSEGLRQAVAEAFAAIPEEGYPVLYDAISHDDYLLRRAAVFGLRRIPTKWALIALYRAMLEDEQWYVKSAAEQAFGDMRIGEGGRGAHAYPAPEGIPWLRGWVAGLESGAIKGDMTGADLLEKALEEGEPQVQALSALNMGQLGMVGSTSLLYAALRHRSDDVRQAAHRALGEIQLQLGTPLPDPA